VANSVSNVIAGKPNAAGGVWGGPLGSPVPTDATTALNAALKPYGYISEDGLTENIEASTEKIKAWGGDIVKVVQTDYSVSYTFTFIESQNADVLKAVFGADNVVTTAATTTAGTKHAVKRTSDILPHQVWVFEVKDGDARVRVVVPDGQATLSGEITYVDGGVISYSVTVEAFRDATTAAQSISYSDDGKFSA